MQRCWAMSRWLKGIMNPRECKRMAEQFASLLPKCKRCGKPFEPRPTRLKGIPMTRCCEECACRNFFDGLDLPTHPSLLDKHTKNPTLTPEEWRRKIKE